jgi:hypothetical protein
MRWQHLHINFEPQQRHHPPSRDTQSSPCSGTSGLGIPKPGKAVHQSKLRRSTFLLFGHGAATSWAEEILAPISYQHQKGSPNLLDQDHPEAFFSTGGLVGIIST